MKSIFMVGSLFLMALSTSALAQSEGGGKSSSRMDISYLGLAGNIGLDGDTSSMSDNRFAIISKMAITSAISLRPAVIIASNSTVLIPVAYDIYFGERGGGPLGLRDSAPYLGVGAAIKSGNDAKIALLITGGLDVPVIPQFTATASVNAGLFSSTDVSFMLGVGYNLTGFY